MPAATSAAATLSPSRASSGAPSNVRRTTARESSRGLLNMEPPGAEGLEALGRKPAARDEGCEGERMPRRERHATVAGGDEGAGALRRFLVDRKAVLRHHTQRRPAAHDVE